VEASGASMLSYAELDDTADMLSDEEHEQLRAEQHRQDMNDRRALLLAKVPHTPGEPVVAAAVAAFGVSDQTARSWMKGPCWLRVRAAARPEGRHGPAV
jgi:hypothetical protein